jgi:hypothetical protein
MSNEFPGEPPLPDRGEARPPESPGDRVPKPLHDATGPVFQQLTPEQLAWAREQFSEEEIVAGLREIRKTGGLELKDFISDLERLAGDE